MMAQDESIIEAQSLIHRAIDIAMGFYSRMNAEGKAEVNTFISIARQASRKLEDIERLVDTTAP